MTPKYLHIKVQLLGKNGNAFAIIGRVIQRLQRNGVPPNEIVKFQEEATSGDYDNVLQTCMKWVDVE